MELLKMSQVAQRLKISKPDAYKLVDRGLIKCTIVGSKKVPDFVLDEFIKNSVGKDLSDLDNVKEL